VRERVGEKILDIKFISTKDRVVDTFTKTLGVKDLDEGAVKPCSTVLY
jgi:hypothetical protein